MTNQEIIDSARRHLDTDPSICAWIVRELPMTLDAGMNDLAWAMTKDNAYVHKNDAVYLLDELEKFINSDTSRKDEE